MNWDVMRVGRKWVCLYSNISRRAASVDFVRCSLNRSSRARMGVAAIDLMVCLWLRFDLAD